MLPKTPISRVGPTYYHNILYLQAGIDPATLAPPYPFYPLFPRCPTFSHPTFPGIMGTMAHPPTLSRLLDPAGSTSQGAFTAFLRQLDKGVPQGAEQLDARHAHARTLMEGEGYTLFEPDVLERCMDLFPLVHNQWGWTGHMAFQSALLSSTLARENPGLTGRVRAGLQVGRGCPTSLPAGLDQIEHDTRASRRWPGLSKDLHEALSLCTPEPESALASLQPHPLLRSFPERVRAFPERHGPL